MTTEHMKALTQVMQAAARRAGMALLRDFSEIDKLQVSNKGPSDFVTNADEKSEEIIKHELMTARPYFSFVGEESGEDGESDHCFIVDPLDGTTNFMHALPHWAIHIAYLYKGETFVAVTYDPIKDEMFSAAKGEGAYVNDQRLRVSGRKRMSEALIATGMPFKGMNEDKHAEYLERLGHVMAKTAGVRRFGSASLDLAYVAAGRYEGFFEYGLNSWDIAGGILFVREAGGFVVDQANRTYKMDGTGQQKKWIVASNYEIATDFIQTLNGR